MAAIEPVVDNIKPIKRQVIKKPVSVRALFSEWIDCFKIRNRPKELGLFLYKRPIEVLHFTPRVFIKLDTNGRKFIDEILSDDFQRKVTCPEISKTSYIKEIFCNDRFKLEFVDEKYWNHLVLSWKLADLTGSYMNFDSIVRELIGSLDSDPICFKFKPEAMRGLNLAKHLDFTITRR